MNLKRLIKNRRVSDARKMNLSAIMNDFFDKLESEGYSEMEIDNELDNLSRKGNSVSKSVSGDDKACYEDIMFILESEMRSIKEIYKPMNSQFGENDKWNNRMSEIQRDIEWFKNLYEGSK